MRQVFSTFNCRQLIFVTLSLCYYHLHDVRAYSTISIYIENAILHNSFSNKYLSRCNSYSLDYQCQQCQSRELSPPLPLGAISLAIFATSIYKFGSSVWVLVCLFVSNKRQNGWTDRAQIFCGTSRDHREDLWMTKIFKNVF